MAHPLSNFITLTDYLAIEEEDHQRYEYHDGRLFAMAGGTLNHTMLCGNVFGMLRDATEKKGICLPFTSEMKIEVNARRRYVYPDAGVACPKFKESDSVTGAIVNPQVIVEVLSEGSANYDRGEKWEYYFGIPTVREYLLIEQDRPHVTLFRRQKEGQLFHIQMVSGLDATIELASINTIIALDELYRNVEFPPDRAEAQR